MDLFITEMMYVTHRAGTSVSYVIYNVSLQEVSSTLVYVLMICQVSDLNYI